jgi:DNA-binding CsgD family transcriptional regulator/tetratricopeptide (TPR) repeat protein
MKVSSAGEWPFVGRRHELDELANSVIRGGSALVVGRSGAGRTRLLAAAADQVGSSGAIVIKVGTMVSGKLGSITSLHEWLRHHVTEPSFERFMVKRGSAKLAAGDWVPGEVVLCIDDVHLMNPESAHVLHHLVRLHGVRILGSFLRGAIVPDGIERLWVNELASRVELSEFDSATTEAAVHSRLGERIDIDSLRSLHLVTGGNALLVREVVEQSLIDGQLSRGPRGWFWRGLGKPSRRLIDVVRLQMGRLSVNEREIIDRIALLSPLRSRLRSVVERGTDVEALLCRGLLRAEAVDGDVQLSLTYPVWARVRKCLMSEVARRRLRASLADDIEADSNSRGSELAQAVELRLRSGNSPGEQLLLAAAAAALEADDARTAEEMCRMVDPADPPSSLLASLLLGRALSGQRRYQEAEVVLGHAHRHASAGGFELERLVVARASNLAWGLGRGDDAVRLLDEAVAELGEDSRVTRLVGLRTEIWVLTDRLREVADAGRAAADRGAAGSALMPALVGPAAVALLELGDAQGARHLLDRCSSETASWAPEYRLFHQMMVVAAALHTGGFSRWNSNGAVALLPDAPDVGRLQVTVMRARVQRWVGEVTEAVALFREALRIEHDGEWLSSRAWTLAQLAGALAESGKYIEAMRVLRQARAEERDSPRFPIAVDGVAVESVRVLAHLGDARQARREAWRLARRAAAAGRVASEMTALHLIARFGDARAVMQRSAVLARRSSSGLIRLKAEHIHALSKKDAFGLRAVSERFLDLGLRPLALEAAAQACRAYRARVGARGGRDSVAWCRRLVHGHEDHLPRWVHAEPGSASDLTTREYEVAALVASGRSNREVSEELVVSVRTVENHLQRVYTKLGIDSRAAIREVLRGRVATMPGSRAPR